MRKGYTRLHELFSGWNEGYWDYIEEVYFKYKFNTPHDPWEKQNTQINITNDIASGAHLQIYKYIHSKDISGIKWLKVFSNKNMFYFKKLHVKYDLFNRCNSFVWCKHHDNVDHTGMINVKGKLLIEDECIKKASGWCWLKRLAINLLDKNHQPWIL